MLDTSPEHSSTNFEFCAWNPVQIALNLKDVQHVSLGGWGYKTLYSMWFDLQVFRTPIIDVCGRHATQQNVPSPRTYCTRLCILTVNLAAPTNGKQSLYIGSIAVYQSLTAFSVSEWTAYTRITKRESGQQVTQKSQWILIRIYVRLLRGSEAHLLKLISFSILGVWRHAVRMLVALYSHATSNGMCLTFQPKRLSYLHLLRSIEESSGNIPALLNLVLPTNYTTMDYSTESQKYQLAFGSPYSINFARSRS